MNLSDLEKYRLLAGDSTALNAEQALSTDDGAELPWIAKLLLGLGGWITAIFLAGFTGLLAFESLSNSEETALFIIGAIYLAISIFASRKSQHPFLTQLTLAIGVTGIILIISGLWDAQNPDGLLSTIAIIVICPVVYLFSQNSILKFIAVLSAIVTASIFLQSQSYPQSFNYVTISTAILACVFLSSLFTSRYWRPALLATVSGLLYLLYLPQLEGNRGPTDFIIISAIISLGFGSALWSLLKPDTKASVGIIVFCLLLFTIAYFGSPGIAASIGVITIAHARQDTSLSWLGILALAVFVIAFYYFLSVPLLTKSYLLLGIGALLLIGSITFNRLVKS